jgi:hypothetical protein
VSTKKEKKKGDAYKEVAKREMARKGAEKTGVEKTGVASKGGAKREIAGRGVVWRAREGGQRRLNMCSTKDEEPEPTYDSSRKNSTPALRPPQYKSKEVCSSHQPKQPLSN